MRSQALHRTAYGVLAVALAVVLAVGVSTVVAGVQPSSQPAGGATVARGVNPLSVDVSGRRVVWAERAQGSEVLDIFLRDTASGTTSRLTDGTRDDLQPAIDGDTVVWVSYSDSGTGADIYAYHIPTRAIRVINSGPGDQIAPDISGRWVVWEDRSTGFSPSIRAFDLTTDSTFTIASSRNFPKRSPEVAGDVVVFEDYPRGALADADVVVYDLAQRAEVRRIGDASTGDFAPSTDGRYVAWVRGGADGDRDVWTVDLRGGGEFEIAGGPGEQAFPALDTGVAYWVENSPGTRLHLRSRALPGGASRAVGTSRSGNRSGGVGAFAAGRGSVVWTESVGSGTQIRAVFGRPPATRILSQLLPATSAWPPFRLAQVSAPGDVDAPAVRSASVDPGATFVDPRAPLTVRFSEPIDASTLDAQSVTLVSAANGQAVAASVRYSVLSRMAVVEPNAPLAEGSYTLTVSSAIADRAGNALREPFAVSFSTVSTHIDTLAPRPPQVHAARVAAESGTNAVALRWTKPADNVGVTSYLVYAHTAPITLSLISSLPLTPVATITAGPGIAVGALEPTATVSAANARATSYTLYYAVRARDATGNLSPLSVNLVANPHGTQAAAARSCAMCHQAHTVAPSTEPTTPAPSLGRLAARSAEGCFVCHGSTAHGTAFGLGAATNTQAEFFSYSSNPLPAAGSRHRNAAMELERRECTACHAIHLRPFRTTPDTSFRDLLMARTGASTFVFSTDAVPFRNDFCFSCHGAQSGNIPGGLIAYGATAGDHNSANFDTTTSTVAHGSRFVQSTRETAQPGPRISCNACHNEHASPVNNLIDYRGRSTAAVNFDQSRLCFACHSATSVETRSVGVRPFAWNSRSVEAEFRRRSRHPVTATATAGVASLTCYSCHNVHFVDNAGTAAWDMRRVSDPRNTRGVFTGTSTQFCLNCHGNAAPPVATVSATTLVPYSVRLRTMGVGTFPFFGGWNKESLTPTLTFATSTHAATTSTGRALCENCHDPHGSDFESLVAWTRPAGWAAGIPGVRSNTTTGPLGIDNLCLQCHGDGTVGRTAPVGAGSTTRMNVWTPASGAVRHPISRSQTTVDVRHSSTETTVGIGAGNRHAECVDCHNPHVARKTPGRTDGLAAPGTSVAGGALYGVVGVIPTATVAGIPASATLTYTRTVLQGRAGDFEAYLCFRCHSSYTTRPAGASNVAMEFNPRNHSGHNVVGRIWPRTTFTFPAVGTFTWQFATGSFQPGWTSTSVMTCSDCHTGADVAGRARGPHGSSARAMIDPAFPFDWQSAHLVNTNAGMSRGAGGERAICEKCHNLRPGGTWGNNAHGDDAHWEASYGRCVHCHVRIPHGWNRPRLLGLRSDPEPYRVITGGLSAIRAKNYTRTNWAVSDCTAACHTRHAPVPSPLVP